jgi:hypothetical protein
MAGLLESANAKLQRAVETGQVLLAEIEAFLSANPTPYRIVGELRNQNTEYVFTAFGQLPVPIRFSVLLGEILYQLRTALDHLLTALVTANGSTPTDKHQFPICSTPEKLVEARRRGDFAGISASASTIVEQLQPYQTEHPTPSLLNLMREWNNADKHRLLVVVGGAAALGDRVTIEESDSAFSISGMTPPHIRKVTDQGASVFTIFLGEPHETFRATAEFRPHVAVENVGSLECASVAEVVAKMIGFTRYIFLQFAQEFT